MSYGDGVRDEAQHIFLTYGRDHRLSFCDAVTFVVVTTMLDHVPCLSFDKDLRGLGLTVLVNAHRFRWLPFPSSGANGTSGLNLFTGFNGLSGL